MSGSIKQNGKHTAEATAFGRAVGRLDSAICNPDFLAERILSFGFRVLLLPGLRNLARIAYERRLPGIYLWLQARTKYLDRLFVAAIPESHNIVILGAGLDTRAYRFANQLKDVRIFEVDHPGTAKWKRERLHRLDRATDHVTFISMDFNVDRLDHQLKQGGCDLGMPTFFLWEGVTMYLPQESIENTLAVIAGAATGSSVAFDYLYKRSMLHPESFIGAEEFYSYAVQRGEPCRFGLDPDEIASFLAKRGLTLVSNSSPEEMSRTVPPGFFPTFASVAYARRDNVAPL